MALPVVFSLVPIAPDLPRTGTSAALAQAPLPPAQQRCESTLSAAVPQSPPAAAAAAPVQAMSTCQSLYHCLRGCCACILCFCLPECYSKKNEVPSVDSRAQTGVEEVDVLAPPFNPILPQNAWEQLDSITQHALIRKHLPDTVLGHLTTIREAAIDQVVSTYSSAPYNPSEEGDHTLDSIKYGYHPTQETLTVTLEYRNKQLLIYTYKDKEEIDTNETVKLLRKQLPNQTH